LSAAAATLAQEEPPQISRWLWLAAAAVALALHLSGLLFVLSDTDDDSDLAFGAPALAIDVDLAAPSRPPTNLPAGPDSEQSTASPQMVQEQEVLKQSDLPEDMPVESDDPARAVALDNARKPIDDDPNVKPVQTAPSTEAAATEASAMPSSENVPESQRATAAVLGIGESARMARVTWQKALAVLFDKNKRYPENRPHRSIDVKVRFQIDRLGHLLSSSISQSSGDSAFDEAALAMLKRADPFPPPPPAIADAPQGLDFDFVVNFHPPAAHRRAGG
jgi:protein TonB